MARMLGFRYVYHRLQRRESNVQLSTGAVAAIAMAPVLLLMLILIFVMQRRSSRGGGGGQRRWGY